MNFFMPLTNFNLKYLNNKKNHLKTDNCVMAQRILSESSMFYTLWVRIIEKEEDCMALISLILSLNLLLKQIRV